MSLPASDDSPQLSSKSCGKTDKSARNCRHNHATSCDHIARVSLVEEEELDEAGPKSTDVARRAARSVLKQEQLILEITQHITKFPDAVQRKDIRLPRSAAELWKRARQVVSLQQEVKDFNAEVRDWYKKFPALEVAKHSKPESITERQEHRLEFWAKYRARAEVRDLPPAPLPPPALARRAKVLGRGLPRDCAAACDPSGGPLETRGNFWGKAVAKDVRGSLRAQARASACNEKRSILAGLATAAVASRASNKKKQAAPSEAHSLSWTRRAARDTNYKHKGWALGRRFREQASSIQESSSAPELLLADTESEDESEAEQERSPQLLRLLPDIKGAPGAKLMFARLGEDELDKRRAYGRKTAARWQEQMQTVLDDPEGAELSPVHTRDSRHWAASFGKEGLSTGLQTSKHNHRFTPGLQQWGIPSAGHSTSKSPQRRQRAEAGTNGVGWARKSKRASLGPKSCSLPTLTQREAVGGLHRPRASTTVAKKSKKGGGVAPLPPIAGAFGEGWRDETNASDVQTEPTKRYVRACQHFGVLPTPSLPFVTGQSLKFEAGDRALVDSDLLAVAAMVRSMNRIEEVDLEDNTLLTEKALVVFLRKLFGRPASSSLERLSIKRCLHAGRGGALDVIVQLLSEPDGLHSLQHLDLSGVPLSARCHLALCNAIWEHPALSSVSLADTGLGNGPFAEQCVAKLVSGGNVQCLDIGWNTFNTEALKRIGEQLVGTQTLQSLSLSNCSAVSDNASNTSILFFLEHLSHDRSLTFLDISLNRIDYQGALVIEDALELHPCLTKINIAHNPLGIVGVRSLFRLFAQGSSGLLQLTCDGCLAVDHPTPRNAQLFQMSRPAGHYTLHLDQPYDRALLRLLYKTCERLDIDPSNAFLQVDVTCEPFQHPREKDTAGQWPVPHEGTLIIVFSLIKSMEGECQDIPDSEFIELFEQHMTRMKVHIDPSKAVALLALWQSVEGRVKEQRAMVNALSSDLLFRYPLLEQLCKHHPFVSEIASGLLLCVTGGEAARHLTTLLAPTLDEQLALHKRLSVFQEFNIQNPTGHYQLDLGDAAHASMGERLLCLDGWEALIAQRSQQQDISQRGNYSQIRNADYKNAALDVPMVACWKLPHHGLFKFDYVSGRRPPAGVQELRQDAFSEMLISLRKSEIESHDQVKALRQVSSEMYLSSMQLRELMVNMGDRFVAEELAVIFFMRVSDMCNEKQFRVRCPNLDALRRRLGYVTTFPFFQPEHLELELDFAVHDQRLAGKLLALLFCKEQAASLQNLSYVRADGKQDLLPNGMPRMWAESPPNGGTFRAKYIVSPDNRQLAERRRLFETYGRWNLGNNRVTWWTDLTEVPEDVIMYLQLLIGKYRELGRAFRDIDGLDGNGVVSLKEFQESVQTWNSPKFQGALGKRRILGIYRFLDPNGDGSITMKEWAELEQICLEMTSSIVEFTEGVGRAFNGNLAAAWKELDADGSGGLDEDEWCAAAEKAGYFGPAKVVFNFLDKSGTGVVSMRQFMQLKAFEKSTFNHRRALRTQDSTLETMERIAAAGQSLP